MLDMKKEYTEECKQDIAVHKQIITFEGNCAKVHSHDYIEILYTLGGKFNVWLNGNYFEFSKGDMVVINSQEVHCINSITEDKNGAYICLRFIPDIIAGEEQKIYNYKYVLPFLTNHNPPQKVFTAKEIEKTNIPDIFMDIYKEYYTEDYAHELAIRSDIYKIFVWILRYWKKEGLDAENKIDIDLSSRLQPIIEYIAKHFSEPLTAEQMAEHANMSYSYFSRSFKLLTRRGFSEYLNFVRITESEKLLLTTDMNITEIALQIGFSTSSYFIRQFKLYKKLSPKQFKKTFLS